MNNKLLLAPRIKFWDSDNVPLAGGLVYTYDAGTVNAQTTYSDYLLTTPNTNPVVLDANGEAIIYYDVPLKIVVKTAAGVTIDNGTIDNLTIGDVPTVTLPSAAAGGTVDVITAVFSPVLTALTNNLTVIVEASGANTSTTPTFNPDGLGARTICKGNDVALLVGDIPGANFRMILTYDTSIAKWVLANPYCVNSYKTGNSVQVVYSETGTYDTNAPGTQIPADNTLPGIAEGDEYMSCAITPTKATNLLKIEITGVFASSGATTLTLALHQIVGGVETTLKAVPKYVQTNPAETISFRHMMLAGTTNALTFKLFAGPSGVANIYFNGDVAVGALFNGGCASSIVITEYEQ